VFTKLDATYEIAIPNFLNYFGSYSKTDRQNVANKRKENKIKEKCSVGEQKNNSPHISAHSGIPITPDSLVQMFNARFNGLLKPAIGLGSGPHLQNFMATCRLLDTPEKWGELINAAYDQKEFLVKKSKVPLTLTWLVEEQNALKVLEGKYGKSLALEDDELSQWAGGFTNE